MKNILIALGVLVLVAGVIGAYFYPKLVGPLAGSPAGSNFADPKIAEQIVTTSTSTVFSQLNTDGSDRIIDSVSAFLQNGAATTSVYSVVCATSSSPSGFVPANVNYVLNQQLNSGFGTSTGSGGLFLASSSPGITGTSTATIPANLPPLNPYARVWKAGSYLICSLTASGSNNAANTLDAATTGFFGFPYRPQ